jgi:hypothetical protein
MHTLAEAVDHTDVYVPAIALVVASVVSAIGATVGAWLAYVRGRAKGIAVASPDPETIAADERERREYREKVDAIHEQVNNDHETNLRNDVDRIAGLVHDMHQVLKRVVSRMDRTSRDVGAVKRSVESIQASVTELNDRLDEHIDGR